MTIENQELNYLKYLVFQVRISTSANYISYIFDSSVWNQTPNLQLKMLQTIICIQILTTKNPKTRNEFFNMCLSFLSTGP